jgi:putative hydrolase of the HAD superfamily
MAIVQTSERTDRLVDAVIFDFGGVLTSPPFNPFRAWATENGHDPEVLVRLFLGPAVDGDHPFHKAERGEIPAMDVFVAARAEAAEMGIDLASMTATPNLTAREDVVAFIQQLKDDGITVALISNNFKEMAGQWRALVAIDDLFDVVVESSVEGVRKPAPEIYERTLERLGVRADRAVFLDDLIDNIHGANAVGMHTILVTEQYHDALAEVDRLLGR